MASGAWPTANVAVYMPFTVHDDFPVKQLRFANGSTVSGNVDIGVYDSDADGLPRTRLISAGSTGQTDTFDIQLFNVATTTLVAALYYVAGVLDNTTGQAFSFAAPMNTGFGLV
ncbi:MAG: hypothetical protein IIB31_05770, partial [Chloroflexi bacterium]|nr:hypothetical protein [Chloroflexota bacterium]